MGLWWALGRSCGPQVPQKVDFLDPFGCLWAPFGRPVAPFGLTSESFSGRLCVPNRVFLPCDVQAHFLPHFRVFFRAFWECFGWSWGSKWLSIWKSAHIRKPGYFLRKTEVRVGKNNGKCDPARPPTCLKTVTSTRA